MSEYHLSIGDQRSGPHSQFYIIEGIRSQTLRGGEMVWRKGLDGWQPLKGLEDFSSYWPPSPEVLAQAEAARQVARSELDRPQPWLRFWARMIDFIWFWCAFSMLLAVLAPGVLILAMKASQMYIPTDPFILLIYVPLEAWMLSRFGTTPGKSLLRIQIRTLPGGLPTFRQAMLRTFQMVLRGLALGVFPISLGFMLWNKLKLAQRPVTAWDETAETRVEHGEPEPWRYLLVAGILLGVVLTLGLIMQQVWPELEAMRRDLSK